MKRCCICDKEAEYYHDGLWWCEDHSRMYDEEAESVDKAGDGKRKITSGKNNPIELGLHWV